ncbi:MAG: hypothetical protein WBZ35_09350, partial [Pseudolabrys sp.]
SVAQRKRAAGEGSPTSKPLAFGGMGDGASSVMPTSKYSIRSFSSKRRSRFVPNEHAENKNKMITKMITNNR